MHARGAGGYGPSMCTCRVLGADSVVAGQRRRLRGLTPARRPTHGPGLNALQLCTCQFGSATVLLRLLLQLRGEYQPLGSESRRMWQVAMTYSLGFVLTNLAFSLSTTARAAAHATCTHTACAAPSRPNLTRHRCRSISPLVALADEISCVCRFRWQTVAAAAPAAGLRGDG